MEKERDEGENGVGPCDRDKKECFEKKGSRDENKGKKD